MGLTPLEMELRTLARRRMEQGQLPCAVPLRIWAGRGAGQICDLCDQTIQPHEVELEVDQSIQGEVRTLRFHSVCQAIWQIECANHQKQ